MQANKKIFPFLILSALTVLLTGCQILQEPLEVILRPDSTAQRNNAISNRFHNNASMGQTAIDSAIELSRKNTELFEQTMLLRQENKELIDENLQLNERIAVLESELELTKKNLGEAEDLLIDMVTELNNWKIDVLGNKEEIRQANMAQMDILLKIAKAMGAEVTAKQAQN